MEQTCGLVLLQKPGMMHIRGKRGCLVSIAQLKRNSEKKHRWRPNIWEMHIYTGVVKNTLLLNLVLFQSTVWLYIPVPTSTATAGSESSSIDFNTTGYKVPQNFFLLPQSLQQNNFWLMKFLLPLLWAHYFKLSILHMWVCNISPIKTYRGNFQVIPEHYKNSWAP